MNPEDEKLDDITARIRQVEMRPETKEKSEVGRNAGFDFSGIVIGSGVLGALLDHVLATSPWCLMGMVFFGFIAGIVCAWRALQDKQN